MLTDGLSEIWVIRWLKKNPHMIQDSYLLQLFTTDIDKGMNDPVLEALGGEKWLESRRHTDKTDHRLTKACRTCRRREPEVKLFQCCSSLIHIP